MKKIFKLFSCFVFSLSLLAACGGGASLSKSPAGTWRAVKGVHSGIEVPMDAVGSGFVIELKDDGKAIVSFGDTSGAGTWKETEKGAVIKDGGETIRLNKKDDVMIYKKDGVVFTFEKQKDR